MLKAETEKKTAITNAEADAEAAKIRAEGEAAAKDALSKSLTSEVIENKKIEKWNGELPYLYGADNALIQVPNS